MATPSVSRREHFPLRWSNGGSQGITGEVSISVHGAGAPVPGALIPHDISLTNLAGSHKPVTVDREQLAALGHWLVATFGTPPQGGGSNE